MPLPEAPYQVLVDGVQCRGRERTRNEVPSTGGQVSIGEGPGILNSHKPETDDRCCGWVLVVSRSTGRKGEGMELPVTG